ncbi:MAG TPA: TfoX/Sxy family protein [Cyclobacteriaceae bacterium]|nr:TfoX/Sxy family protein [Cyclobacteriaceae bacterium]
MAYNEALTDRLRNSLAGVKNIEEKRMFRGVTFMVNGKMCISVGDTTLMCRIDPDLHDIAMEQNGARVLKMRGREYRGFLYVDEEGFRSPKDLKYWVDLCLDYNKRAKASKKKTKAKKKEKQMTQKKGAKKRK